MLPARLCRHGEAVAAHVPICQMKKLILKSVYSAQLAKKTKTLGLHLHGEMGILPPVTALSW